MRGKLKDRSWHERDASRFDGYGPAAADTPSRRLTDVTVTCLQGAIRTVRRKMDESLRLRCPVCRAIDWSRDGFTMAVDINGELHRVRINAADPAGAGDPWSCDRCGFEPADGGDLARHLLQFQHAYAQ